MKNVIEKKSSTTAASNAVHDINQQIKEDCLRIIEESHNLASKYHAELLMFSNSNLCETLQHKEKVQVFRKEAYQHMVVSLEHLLPKIDKLSLDDIQICSSSLNQIISYLEYLRFEFLRHLYLINTFYMTLDDQVSLFNFESKSEVSRVTIISFSNELKASKKQEIKEIKKDINQIEMTISKMSEKYFIFIPDLEDIKVWNKKRSQSSKGSSFKLFNNLKFICCLCSPKYI